MANVFDSLFPQEIVSMKSFLGYSSNVYGDSSNVIKCTQGKFRIGNKMLISILEKVKLAKMQRSPTTTCT